MFFSKLDTFYVDFVWIIPRNRSATQINEVYSSELDDHYIIDS